LLLEVLNVSNTAASALHVRICQGQQQQQLVCAVPLTAFFKAPCLLVHSCSQPIISLDINTSVQLFFCDQQGATEAKGAMWIKRDLRAFMDQIWAAALAQ
jgi:hypothetical protein